MQFSPTVWGPFFWHTIHIAALGYSKEPTYTEKRAAKEFFESFQFMIPCGVCKEHYAQHLKTNPITPFLDRRQDLFRWTVMVHNAVNVTLKKPTLTEQDVLAYYNKLGKRDRSPVWTKDDMKEVDLHSFIRGFCIGFLGIGLIGGGVWGLNKLNMI